MKTTAITALIALLFLSGANCMKAQETSAPAPDFSLVDLAGKKVTLSDYKGKVLLVNFWATWCPPCREEIPDFIEVYKEYRDSGLEILGVSVDNIGAQKLAEWARNVGINYPVALATRDIVMDYEPGDYIPASIFIDGDGRIRYKHVGLLKKDVLIRLFKEYSR